MADHACGGRLAAEALLTAGCRRLAVVSSAARTASLVGRVESFRARVKAAGVPLRVWQEGRATDYGTGRQAGLALLGRGKVDGVFCVTDLLALGFKTQFVVVFGTSTSAFQLPSACLPHTTTYFAFNVCGFPFASGTVSE